MSRCLACASRKKLWQERNSMEKLEGMHYDAFISYRHCEPDSFVAQSIHRRLEAFKLPRSARSKVGDGKTRISRVFRDEEELPLADNLSEPINNALANSEFLICICSPRYPESKWCMREIEVFLQTHDREHILVVLAEGEPAESFPRLLTVDEVEVRDEEGRVSTVKREIEPLAADTRGEGKKEITKTLDTAVMKLSAAIFGLSFDDLRQRHREARLKRLIAVSSGIGAAVLVFAVFATFALVKISRQNTEIWEQNEEIRQQNHTISDQYDELQDRYAEQIASSAETQMGKGKRKDAVRSLRSVLPDEKKYNADALRMLYNAMNIYGIDGSMEPVETYETEEEILSFDVSYDGRYVLENDPVSARVFDTETGDEVARFDRESVKAEDSFSGSFCGSDGIIILDGEKVEYRSVTDPDDRHSLTEIETNSAYFPSPDGKVTLVCSEDSVLAIDQKGTVDYRIDTKKLFGKTGLNTMSVSFDKEQILITFSDSERTYVVVVDEKNGDVIYSHHERAVGESSGVIHGDTIWYSVTDVDTRTGEARTGVSSVDFRTGKRLWEQALPEYASCEIRYADGGIFIDGESGVQVLDADSGELLYVEHLDDEIVESWVQNNIYHALTISGSVYEGGRDYLYDDTEIFYQYRPVGNVAVAVVRGDSLFYVPYRGDYVVRQSPEIAKGAELIDPEYEADEVWYEADAEEESPEISGINPALIDDVFYSTDEKWIVAVLRDHTVKILDASSREEVRTLQIDEEVYDGMRYSEAGHMYILDSAQYSYLLDDDLNLICVTNRIISEEGNRFVMSSPDGKYYRVPFVSYEELLQRADAMIAGKQSK